MGADCAIPAATAFEESGSPTEIQIDSLGDQHQDPECHSTERTQNRPELPHITRPARRENSGASEELKKIGTGLSQRLSELSFSRPRCKSESTRRVPEKSREFRPRMQMRPFPARGLLRRSVISPLEPSVTFVFSLSEAPHDPSPREKHEALTHPGSPSRPVEMRTFPASRLFPAFRHPKRAHAYRKQRELVVANTRSSMSGPSPEEPAPPHARTARDRLLPAAWLPGKAREARGKDNRETTCFRSTATARHCCHRALEEAARA